MTGIMKKRADMFRPRVEATEDNVMEPIPTYPSPTGHRSTETNRVRRMKDLKSV